VNNRHDGISHFCKKIVWCSILLYQVILPPKKVLLVKIVLFSILFCPESITTNGHTDVSGKTICRLFEVSRAVFSDLPPNSCYNGYGTELCRPLTCNKGGLNLKAMQWFPDRGLTSSRCISSRHNFYALGSSPKNLHNP
jgi:hypothetical protein